MQYVYCCEKCKAVGRSYRSSCQNCSWGKIQEIPFDGKFVLVQDPDLLRKLKNLHEQYGEKGIERL